MTIRKQLAVYVTVMLNLLAFSGCSSGQVFQLANEITFSLDGISEVTISYDEEKVTFYESENNKLTVKEYMTENKISYYAKVEQSSGSIKISEGGKPLFKGSFSRYIEVYLPASYHGNLTVTTTNGDIDISGILLSLNSLRIDSTSGTLQLGGAEAQNIYLSSTSGKLELGSLNADTIRIDTTRGDVTCEKLDGNVSYTTTSGNAEIKSAAGSGNYRANNSGKLNVVYTEVTGDLSFFNKNDNICITLPADLEFEFSAATKNGSVSTSFQECVSINGRTTSGTVGEHPTVNVRLETNNGKIEVKQ